MNTKRSFFKTLLKILLVGFVIGIVYSLFFKEND